MILFQSLGVINEYPARDDLNLIENIVETLADFIIRRQRPGLDLSGEILEY